MNFIIVLSVVFSSLLYVSVVDSAKILAYFYFPSISHQYIFREIVAKLSLKGHQVTFITPNPINDQKLTNLTEIDVSIAYEMFKKQDLTNLNRDNMYIVSIAVQMHQFTEGILDYELNTEKFQEILKKPKNYYDLLLIEPHSFIPFAMKHKFDAPMIAISSLGVVSHLHYLMGNTVHPVLYPDIFSDLLGPLTYQNLGFFESIRKKFDSLYVNFMWYIICEFYSFEKSSKFARKYFGEDMPDIKELIKETSLLMVNNNPTLSDRRPQVANVVEYFNIHLTRNKELPKDLEEILNKSTNGVVYFSLGTNVRFDHVEGNVKDTILKALGALKYTVLCKWESDDHAGKPKNIVLRKWFPQQSVLAHPNVKVFVTQGGLQSAEEAISNGVPLVVIPFLGDQPMNAKILTNHGMAETIPPKTLTEELLRDTINKVASDEKYRVRAKELRGIFLDQPQSGIDKIIWWCEYVIRHKGAKHLRSPGADISLYEYFMLDVLAVILTCCLLVYIVLSFILRRIVRLLYKKKPKRD